jgi:hypothetical protein
MPWRVARPRGEARGRSPRLMRAAWGRGGAGDGWPPGAPSRGRLPGDRQRVTVTEKMPAAGWPEPAKPAFGGHPLVAWSKTGLKGRCLSTTTTGWWWRTVAGLSARWASVTASDTRAGAVATPRGSLGGRGDERRGLPSPFCSLGEPGTDRGFRLAGERNGERYARGGGSHAEGLTGRAPRRTTGQRFSVVLAGRARNGSGLPTRWASVTASDTRAAAAPTPRGSLGERRGERRGSASPLCSLGERRTDRGFHAAGHVDTLPGAA